MNFKQGNSQPNPAIKTMYKFIGGATLGAFMVIIPMLYGASTDLNLFQV